MKTFYALSGLFISAIVNILYNLIAAAIQKRALNDQFDNNAVLWLIGLALIGMIIGYLIGNMSQRSSHQNNNSHGQGRKPGSSNAQSGSSKYNINADKIGSVGDNNNISINEK